MFDSPFFELLFGAAVCCLVLGLTWRARTAPAADLRDKQFRARSLGRGREFEDVARSAFGRATEISVTNARYLRQLKQANWFWAIGEVLPPAPRAPFWNLETLWTEKYVTALVYAALGLVLGFALLLTQPDANATLAIAPALAAGAALGYLGFTAPDAQLRDAARKRQKELALEMGFRLPELRSDVLAGRTIMSAMRELGRRPGGPFVEEIRRAVTAFDVLKDEAAALDVLADRNAGTEQLIEFVSQMRMAIQQGNEVNRVLNVLTDAAQHRLVQHVTAQGKKNAQQMSRPLAAGSVAIMALLVLLPAALAVGALLAPK
jgi:hypothetical protein